MLNYDVLIRSLPTPNPMAFKFVLNCPLKNNGKATFNSKKEAEGIPLIESLLDLAPVLQAHVFENVLTITYHDGADVDKLNQDVTSILQTRMAIHDPHFLVGSEKEIKKKRENLTPELQTIEEILDRTIRPGLQADGGDLDVLSYENHTLLISYQGACGTCPSSMYGTLDAIQSILQNEFDPELQVMIG